MNVTFVASAALVLGVSLQPTSVLAWDNPGDRYLDAHKKYADASCPIEKGRISHFVYFARDREAIRDHVLLTNDNFSGAQIMYPWRQLEPSKGQYDFSDIREDVDYLAAHGKRLFIQLQDASFTPDYKPVPDYLLDADNGGGAVPQYAESGDVEGWVAKRWDDRVQVRFAALLEALGKEFDGEIEGINLQETAIGVTPKVDPSFSPARYAEGIEMNMRAMKAGFPTSTTMQYANFMPGEWLPWEDEGYLKGIYKLGEEIGVGLGGPDLMFKRKGALNHTIAMMHEHDYTAPLGIAIQDGNYIGQTASDEVVRNRPNIVPVLHAFANDFMKVDYMFWVDQEPYFAEDVLPCFPSD
ncbi:MAG: hypothetical protein AAGA50_10585 [Pseudomonadota bacterium]